MSSRVPWRRPVVGAVLSAALIACVVTSCSPAVDDEPTTTLVTPAPPGGASPTGDTAPDDVASDAEGTDGDQTAADGSADDETTDADVAFVAAMIAHHEQAVELTSLAPGRASDAELAELAGRMHVVQAAEADAMRAWLERRRTRDRGLGHDHALAMAGEISRSTIDRAEALDGPAFDELFLASMVPHHRGAVEMAETRLAEHGDPAVARWARSIATAQALEIDRLLEIEARLGQG